MNRAGIDENEKFPVIFYVERRLSMRKMSTMKFSGASMKAAVALFSLIVAGQPNGDTASNPLSTQTENRKLQSYGPTHWQLKALRRSFQCRQWGLLRQVEQT